MRLRNGVVLTGLLRVMPLKCMKLEVIGWNYELFNVTIASGFNHPKPLDALWRIVRRTQRMPSLWTTRQRELTAKGLEEKLHRLIGQS